MPRIWSKRGAVYSKAERIDMLVRFYEAWNRAERADEAQDEPSAQQARGEATSIARIYESATPVVSLSRSPFSGKVFESSLDNFDIDGLWWAYEFDYRPHIPPVATFFGWTGAMKLEGPIPNVPLKSMVGPEVPFVLPRLLDHPAIKAVVSSVLVGEHVGFPVVYYADPVPPKLERVDDWGHALYSTTKPDGSPTAGHSVEYDYDKDFELGPWLASGKLQWIAPGDIDLTVCSGEKGCPFVALEGQRHRQYIQGGERWFAREVAFPTRTPTP